MNQEQADDILNEYSKPGSMTDEGNLFFAAIEYRNAFVIMKNALEQIKSNGESEWCAWKADQALKTCGYGGTNQTAGKDGE